MTIKPRISSFSLGILVLALLLWPALRIQAQQLREGDVLDRVEAVVGKEVVLKSDVDGQIYMLMQQNPSVNPADPAIRKRIRDAMINDKLVYLKALEDTTMQVSEEEVNQQLDQTVQQIIAQFGSEDRVEKAYGVPLWKIKKDGHDEVKRRILLERMRQAKIGDVRVSRAEVDDFYAKFKDSLPDIPEQVEIGHIVKLIVPAGTAKNMALQKEKKIRDSIVAGGDFCDFAKRYSADPGSASSCGELAMRACSDFVPEFCSAAKKLQLTEYSLPVESPFGYHVIQLLDRTKEQIKTRHILIAVARQEEDVEAAKKFLTEVREKITTGSLSFDDAAKIYSEEKETQGFGGALGRVQIASLDPALKAAVEKLSDGQVTDALPYQAERTKPALHLVLRKKTIAKHKANLETDYKEIERMASMFKQNKEYDNWVRQLRTELYWEVRD
ncbi:MAG: peptidylprolyl isomerase [Candidatus Kapaibacterium sp.]